MTPGVNLRRGLALLLVLAPASSCGNNLASNLVNAPVFDPKGQAKCGVMKSQAEPLIVEWPDAARGKLESQLRRGVVAVRYVGCDMQVLGQCNAPGHYAYTSVNPKKSRVRMRDADELYATIPAYAARFEANLKRSGELDVDMTIVGRFDSENGAVRAEDLTGDCARATHVVTGVSVGSFEFFAGADASVGADVGAPRVGIGGKSTSARETLTADGQEAACGKAGEGDKTPPYGCGALIRLEVQQIVGRELTAEVAPAPVETPLPSADTHAPAPAPASRAASGRFVSKAGGRMFRDAVTGLSWSLPSEGHFETAASACADLKLSRGTEAPARRLAAGFLAQDPMPSPPSASDWRLPTAQELQTLLAAGPPRELVRGDRTDCYWIADRATSSLLRDSMFGQRAVPKVTICTGLSGMTTSTAKQPYLCVRGD